MDEDQLQQPDETCEQQETEETDPIDLTNEEEEQSVVNPTEDTEEEHCDTKAQLQNQQNPQETMEIKQETEPQEQTDNVDNFTAENDAKLAEIDKVLDETLEQTKRQRKQVDLLLPSKEPGKFESGQSHHLLTQGSKPDMQCDDNEALIMARTMVCMVQTHSLKAGINKFGEKGVEAASKEMTQLHERDCFEPVDVSQLSFEEKRKALDSPIFLTEKRDGLIKARTCANGSKQREWMTKEDTASPTVSTPAVMLTCVMDAEEQREVAVVDIPNAFVQTDNEGEVVIMKIKGKLALIPIDVCPEKYLIWFMKMVHRCCV